MSDEFEEMLKTLPLKESSSELDDKIAAIIENESAVLSEPKQFNFSKFLTYAVAAGLFIAIGVTELLRRNNQPVETVVDQTPAENKSQPVKAEKAIKVSTSESSDDFLRGEVIELDNGQLVRPLIRQKTVRKIYYDSATNTQVIVEEPENEIYYVPLEVD